MDVSDVLFTDRASCPQQVPLMMMRPIASMAQSIQFWLAKYPASLSNQNIERHWILLPDIVFSGNYVT